MPLVQQARHLDHVLGRHAVDLGMILLAIDRLQTLHDRSRGLARLAAVGIGLAPRVQRLGHLLAQAARGPAKMGLEDLTDVHARRHAQRIEHDVGMRPVFQERHVLDRQDAADHALVAVTAGHLVARLQLALHRDEHLDHLQHARRQLVAALQLLDAVVELGDDRRNGLVILRLDRFQIALARIVGHRDLPPFALLDLVEQRVVDGGALLDALRTRHDRLADQHFLQARPAGAIEDARVRPRDPWSGGRFPRARSPARARPCRCRDD